MIRMGILLLIVVAVALAVTNPGEQAHKKAVYAKLSDRAGMDGLLGDAAGGVLEKLDVVPLKYNNYFVFSTLTLRDDVVSVGFFKYVQPTSWKRVKEEIGLPELSAR